MELRSPCKRFMALGGIFLPGAFLMPLKGHSYAPQFRMPFLGNCLLHKEIGGLVEFCGTGKTHDSE
jgi:hypothetical protein